MPLFQHFMLFVLVTVLAVSKHYDFLGRKSESDPALRLLMISSMLLTTTILCVHLGHMQYNGFPARVQSIFLSFPLDRTFLSSLLWCNILFIGHMGLTPPWTNHTCYGSLLQTQRVIIWYTHVQ